jgi:uncharacterized protein (TIGR00730 family)
LKRVTVFCGSSHGAKVEYTQAAQALGRALAHRGIGLVYGGSSIGTMGELARSTLDASGHVIGVIPRLLVDREVAFAALPDLRIVETMSERKLLMADLADAFITLPGGIGTMDEFFEMVSWTQLGLQRKRCGLVNVCGYYNRLVDFLNHAVDERFIRAEYRPIIVVDPSPEGLLDKLATSENLPGF